MILTLPLHLVIFNVEVVRFHISLFNELMSQWEVVSVSELVKDNSLHQFIYRYLAIK